MSNTNTPLYSLAKSNMSMDYHAATQGTNGLCGVMCTAGPGYDYFSGLGTPQAPALVAALLARP